MNYEYDIAISFAGEDRLTAQKIAQELKENGIHVFYDEFEEAKLWGENLYDYLHKVYSEKAQYCIMLISKHYASKAWTNHERQSAQERAFRERQAYILPVKIDDTSIPGLPETIGYISLKNNAVGDIVKKALAKLGKTVTSKHTPIPELAVGYSIPLPQLKKSFTERDKDIFCENAFATIRSFFKDGIAELNKLSGIEADFREITTQKFLCKVYRGGSRKSACTIWIGSRFSSNGICYSNEANPDAGSSINESLLLGENDTNLFLKTLMDFGGDKRQMNDHEAANYFWSKLIEPLNR